MPTYEFACRKCGHRLELLRSFHDISLPVCPTCGGATHKLFSGGIGVIIAKKLPAGCSSRKENGSCSRPTDDSSCCGAGKTCGDSPCGPHENQ